jgi:hypothetical protein
MIVRKVIVRKMIQKTQTVLEMESMPLFADLPQAPDRHRSRVGRNRPDSGVQADRHLAAARRLAKAMRRLPDHSAEQTRTGQAICRHLIALLEDAKVEEGSH